LRPPLGESAPATVRDIALVSTVHRRFGIQQTDIDRSACAVEMAMSIAGLQNPCSGEASVASLAVLVDAACGTVNHMQMAARYWTVSTELSIAMSPDFDCVTADVVVASASSAGADGSTALSTCCLRSGGAEIGKAAVRSFATPAGELPGQPTPPAGRRTARAPEETLSELMSLTKASVEFDRAELIQASNPLLNNAIGFLHGGVAAAGLELACAAALNNTQRKTFRTASLVVNFLRPLSMDGGACRYVATAMHVGRRTAVADAHAIGSDGRLAITGRVTAYN
jgi:uncharacterized protein (TIGR00369 family)